MIIGRLRDENGVLFAELAEASALRLHNELLSSNKAHKVNLKVPGFGIKVTEDLVWSVGSEVSLMLWKGTVLAVVNED